MPHVVKTICQMCYFFCGLDVTVDDGRIVKVEGMREHPANHGRLCAKGIACAQLVTDPHRVRTPLRRVGERGSGKWESATWDEALDEIAEKMLALRQKHGPESVGYYRGQAPGWCTNYDYVLRFMNAWGSPNVFTHSHLCFTPRAIAHSSTFGPPPEPDYERSNCIMLLGYNPAYTAPVNYAARIVWAKERGAKLIVVDPRFTNTAAKADVFLQPRPGTTGALVLAMIHVIINENLYDADFIAKWTVGFDQLKDMVQQYPPDKVESITWVPAELIAKAARMIATIKPAVVVVTASLAGGTVQTVRTTSILRSLIRSVDEPGGSILMPTLPFVDVQMRGSRPEGFEEKAVLQYPLYYNMSLSMTGVELTDAIRPESSRPIRALMVQGGDPATVLSNTGRVRELLQNLDLLVVHDLYRTATAELADWVLPAASFLERDLLLLTRYRPWANGNLLAMQNQCVPPVGESKSDLDLIFALARRVGLESSFLWDDVTEAFDWELEPHDISVAWLRQHPGGYAQRYKPEEIYRKYERIGFPTPSKKIEFVASRLAQQGLDPLPNFVEPAASPASTPEIADDYPFVCSTCLKLGIHTHTQFRTLPWIREIEPDPFAEIHPRTAEELDIQDGDWILVESPTGTMKARARVRATLHPRVVMATHGYGEPYAGGGVGLPNLPTAEKERDPVTGTTGNRSFLCRVRKAEDKR